MNNTNDINRRLHEEFKKIDKNQSEYHHLVAWFYPKTNGKYMDQDKWEKYALIIDSRPVVNGEYLQVYRVSKFWIDLANEAPYPFPPFQYIDSEDLLIQPQFKKR